MTPLSICYRQTLQSKVKIETKGNQITVYIPKVEIIDKPNVLDEEFSQESFINSEDGLINKNKITIEDSTKAMKAAGDTITENVTSDNQLLKITQKEQEI